MNRSERRAAVKRLLAQNKLRSKLLHMVPRERWPQDLQGTTPKEVWVSSRFLVQVFDEENGVERVSVSRTEMADDGNWKDGITWDDLQYVKSQIGRGDLDAVEIYPADRDVVNVANMRHLWVLPHGVCEEFGIGWRRSR